MAASLNKVFLMGNLTRDPEIRYITNGTAITTFTIAVNRAYLTPTGEKKEEVAFIRVVVWGKRAELCNEYLSKGSPAFVEGRLNTRSWEAQDGQKRTSTEVVATNVQFLRGTSAVKQQGASSKENFDGNTHSSKGVGIESIDIDMPDESADIPF